MRLTFCGQSLTTLAAALLALSLTGFAGFWSALLGGAVAMGGSLVFGLIALRPGSTPGAVVRTALRAEAARVLVVVVSLWLVFTACTGLVAAAFIGAFVVAVLLSVLGLAYSR